MDADNKLLPMLARTVCSSVTAGSGFEGALIQDRLDDVMSTEGRGRGIAVVASFDSYVALVAEVSIENNRPTVHRVANAIFALTGKRLRKLPFRLSA